MRAVVVYVTEKERTKRFYKDMLGFEVVADLGLNDLLPLIVPLFE